MSDYQKSMETIFTEAAKALGQIASQKLVNEIFKEEEAKPVTKKAAKAAKEENNNTESRWSRWTKTYTDAFKDSLTKAGGDAPDDKTLEKLKKEFVKYINELTEEDYKKDTKSHTDRMNDFAAIKYPPAKKAETKEEKPHKKTMWEEMNSHETPTDPPSNVATIHEVKDIEELQNNEFLVEVKGSPDGVYWDGKNGRWIKGLRPVDNEDLIEVKFNGKEYNVGEKSLIVYLETDNRDMFMGYCGVGKFKGMRLP